MQTFPPRTMLVPTDLSKTSEPAFLYARTIHDRFGGQVHVLHAQHFELPAYFGKEQLKALRRELSESAKAAAEYLETQSASVLGFKAEVSVPDTAPVEAILEYAARPGIDLVIMGTHGRRGADRFWLGSVAERVLRQSVKPVLAVREGMVPAEIRTVLCPATVTGVSRAALGYAAAVAEAAGARLTVFHAVEPGAGPPDCSLVSESVRGRCAIEEVTHHGHAAGAILTAAEEMKPDVIVMGAEHKFSTFGTLFSSTTERVMRWAHVPLIVVPMSTA